MTHDGNIDPNYTCIRSGGVLRRRDGGDFLSSDGRESYPTISGIPVLTFNPYRLLRAYHDNLDGARAAFDREKPALQALARAASPAKAQRIERVT